MSFSRQILKGKKILIYGAGRTGLSCLNFLKKNNKTFLYDDNYINFESKLIKNFFINKKSIKQKKFDYIILSPGINDKKCNLKNFLKKNKKNIITDMDIFYMHYPNNKTITITGTNGKSTTTSLLSKIIKSHKLDCRLCGNIGNPILSEKNISKKTIFVIEASSYQISYSKIFRTNFAAILNISPDHIERHGSFKNYVRAKFKLITNQSKNDYCFLNKQDVYINREIKNNKIYSKIFKINLKLINIYKKKITNNYFNTPGNLENLSFIFAICKKLKLSNTKIIKKINSFKGLKYRQEIVYRKNNINFINDSKSTSFASSVNILKSSRLIYWLVGGQGKIGDKFNLKKRDCKNIRAYIYGKNKNFFIKKFKKKLLYKCFRNLNSAFINTLIDANKESDNINKTVLFSPSAASFDNFKNFEERGDYFNFLLKKYRVKRTSNAVK